MNRKFIVFIMMIVSFSARAAEVYEFFNGARMLAMGGAQIAVVNDETALLSNPAGLGKLRDKYGTIFDPEMDAGNNLVAIYKQKAFSNYFDLTEVSQSLNAARDMYYHARFQVFPSFVVKNFGIGIYYRKILDAIMDPTGTQMTTTYYDDVALILGYNFRFFDGRIKIGVTGKAISRIQIDNKALNPAGPLDLSTVADEGTGIGADVGINLAAPWTWLPTLSVVVRDVGGTQFTAGKGLRLSSATIPTAVSQDIDVAFAVFPIHSNHTRSSFTVEYQKLTAAAASGDTTRYVHAGYELNVGDVFFLRAGMNQRYWTAGIEVSGEHLQFQLTSYGEEVGAVGTPTEDRRLLLKLGYRF